MEKPKSIVEVGKLFDERFVDRISGDMWQTTSRDEIKQFWLEHFRSLLESLKMKEQTFPERESDDYDAGYFHAVLDTNTAIQTLLEVK